MAHICPWWLGYALVNPVRRLIEHPRKVLGPFVREGMVVVEPGCGMGYFTLDLVRMVGPAGRVVAIDVQPRMIAALRRRASRAGLLERLDVRLAEPDHLGVEDLSGEVDLVVAIHLVHELVSPALFFAEVHHALKPGGAVLVIELKGHVSDPDFRASMEKAHAAGLVEEAGAFPDGHRSALLRRPAAR